MTSLAMFDEHSIEVCFVRIDVVTLCVLYLCVCVYERMSGIMCRFCECWRFSSVFRCQRYDRDQNQMKADPRLPLTWVSNNDRTRDLAQKAKESPFL